MRNTPVTWPRADQLRLAPAASRRFTLVCGSTETVLPRGHAIIGRGRDCEVVVEDMLVSAQHARFLVSKDALFIEDLGSTNGLIVNEKPVNETVRLKAGDRIILGSTEILIRERFEEGAATEPPPPAPDEERPTFRPPPPLSVPARETAAARRDKTTHPGFDGGETVRTEKQDGLLTMARLADRMITLGRTEAAARLLADHLGGVLARAREGQEVPADVLETVGVYGMKLAQATNQGGFANVALELHDLCERPLPDKAITMLEVIVAKIATLDRRLLARYQATLREATAELTPEQHVLVERIVRIGR